MGLIKAALSAGKSVLADEWREFFTTDAMSNDVLIKRATSQRGGSNTKGSEGVITNGSVIAVPDGTAMILVDNGGIAEFCAEPGEFTYDSSTEPSCFYGGFGKGLLASFNKFKSRFTFGGLPAKDQRIYYVNIKEIMGNKFGTATPMPYPDPVYKNIYVRYFGMYSFKINDPIAFYKNVSGNVESGYNTPLLTDQLTSEFITALDSSLSLCADDDIVFSKLPREQLKIAKYMNDTMDEEWNQKRGLIIISVAIEKVTPDDESRKRIQVIDDSIMLSNPDIAAGRMVGASSKALEDAANNPGGAMNGVLGVGMMGNLTGNMSGGANPLEYLANKKANENNAAASTGADSWKCAKCGNENKNAFCSECGEKRPVVTGWVCSACSITNTSNFCSGCGAKRPEEKKCPECGHDLGDSASKFCPECGKPV